MGVKETITNSNKEILKIVQKLKRSFDSKPDILHKFSQ